MTLVPPGGVAQITPRLSDAELVTLATMQAILGSWTPDLLTAECELLRERPRQTLIGDKNYFGRGFERELSEHGVQLLRPAR